MTLKELIEKIDRIKELEASGVEPVYGHLGAAGELAHLLNTELLEPEKTDD